MNYELFKGGAEAAIEEILMDWGSVGIFGYLAPDKEEQLKKGFDALQEKLSDGAKEALKNVGDYSIGFAWLRETEGSVGYDLLEDADGELPAETRQELFDSTIVTDIVRRFEDFLEENYSLHVANKIYNLISYGEVELPEDTDIEGTVSRMFKELEKTDELPEGVRGVWELDEQILAYLP